MSDNSSTAARLKWNAKADAANQWDNLSEEERDKLISDELTWGAYEEWVNNPAGNSATANLRNELCLVIGQREDAYKLIREFVVAIGKLPSSSRVESGLLDIVLRACRTLPKKDGVIFEDMPAPEKDGKCSRDCPHFHYERMVGWPSAQACYAWNDDLDGPEPYFLTEHLCGPALRVTEP